MIQKRLEDRVRPGQHQDSFAFKALMMLRKHISSMWSSRCCARCEASRWLLWYGLLRTTSSTWSTVSTWKRLRRLCRNSYLVFQTRLKRVQLTWQCQVTYSRFFLEFLALPRFVVVFCKCWAHCTVAVHFGLSNLHSFSNTFTLYLV